jgi:hypothetical protein
VAAGAVPGGSGVERAGELAVVAANVRKGVLAPAAARR